MKRGGKMTKLLSAPYLANGVLYDPTYYGYDNSGFFKYNYKNSSMITNRGIRGLFISQLDRTSEAYYQWWEGTNIAPYDADTQTDYYYYFLTQDYNDSLEIDFAVALGTTTNSSNVIYRDKGYHVDNPEPIVFGGEPWELFYIPEGHFRDYFDTLIFRGFKKDVIYLGLSTLPGETWSSFNGSYKDRISDNDWKSYYSLRDLGGQTPQEISSGAYHEGYNSGYSSGVANNVANDENGVWKLVSNASNAVSSVLKTELMPNITLGGLLAIPLMGLVLFFLLKMIKGNS